jgi:hypothetical protein
VAILTVHGGAGQAHLTVPVPSHARVNTTEKPAPQWTAEQGQQQACSQDQQQAVKQGPRRRATPAGSAERLLNRVVGNNGQQQNQGQLEGHCSSLNAHGPGTERNHAPMPEIKRVGNQTDVTQRASAQQPLGPLARGQLQQ